MIMQLIFTSFSLQNSKKKKKFCGMSISSKNIVVYFLLI